MKSTCQTSTFTFSHLKSDSHITDAEVKPNCKVYMSLVVLWFNFDLNLKL